MELELQVVVNHLMCVLGAHLSTGTCLAWTCAGPAHAAIDSEFYSVAVLYLGALFPWSHPSSGLIKTFHLGLSVPKCLILCTLFGLGFCVSSALL